MLGVMSALDVWLNERCMVKLKAEMALELGLIQTVSPKYNLRAV